MWRIFFILLSGRGRSNRFVVLLNMRRREKFVLSSIFLSLGLLAVQYVSLDYRYAAVGLLSLASYFVSAWALSDDLQTHEWLTIVPLPGLYSLSVGLFYFLLPESFVSRITILVLFGVGMYGLYLTSNIFSVAKGRTIQLLYAAHAIGLLFTILTSLLFLNTIFSLRLPWYLNGVLVGASHFLLIFLSLWSVNLEDKVSKAIVVLSLLLTLIVAELAVAFSFYPFSVWHSTLFIMSFLYISLGILHNYLRSRLFKNTLIEYLVVLGFVGVLFLIFFPLK